MRRRRLRNRRRTSACRTCVLSCYPGGLLVTAAFAVAREFLLCSKACTFSQVIDSVNMAKKRWRKVNIVRKMGMLS